MAAPAHALPGAGDPGLVDVAHQPGAGVGGEPVGCVGGAGGPELGPACRVLLGRGRALLGDRDGLAPGRQAVTAPHLTPAAEPADGDHDADGEHGVVQVDHDDRADGVRLGPGVGDHRVQREQPPAAEVAVPEQRPDEPPHEKRDHRSAEELPGRDHLGLLRGPGPVREPPDARFRGGPRGSQPPEEGGPDGPVGRSGGAGGVRGTGRRGAGARRRTDARSPPVPPLADTAGGVGGPAGRGTGVACVPRASCVPPAPCVPSVSIALAP